MAGYFDDVPACAAYALPTPTDTPYRTPRSMSRRSSRHATPSPRASSPFTSPLGDGYGPGEQKDTANHNNAMLDPRRFTPTLHASLVSEILSLRRDIESKNEHIQSLESNVHSARAEFDTLNDTFSKTSKETRSLKRQMQLLEGGTSSALGELAKERDEAVESVVDVKKRFEASQKKVRSQEEEVEKVQGLWNSDKQTWDNDRRVLERKVHVVESRLKAVLEEFVSQQDATPVEVRSSLDDAESDNDDATGDSGLGHDSDTASIRSLSARAMRVVSAFSNDTSDRDSRSARLSVLSVLNGCYGGTKIGGLSLADELKFDEIEEEHRYDSGHEAEELGKDGNEGDNHPCQGALQDRRDDTGFVDNALNSTPVVTMAEDEELAETPTATATEEMQQTVKANSKQLIVYVDTGIQYSPPPSPVHKASSPELVKAEEHDQSASSVDYEATQRRKRVSTNLLLRIGRFDGNSVDLPSLALMPEPRRNLSDPLSPPETPHMPTGQSVPVTQIPEDEAGTKSAGTQTEEIKTQPQLAPSSAAPPPLPMVIPSIAIHPPLSSPPMPKEPVLPAHSKNAACQVSMDSKRKTRSVSMQTEEIRIDNRPIKLPAHLLPSSISSQPSTPEKHNKTGFRVDARPSPVRVFNKKIRSPESAEPPSSPPAITTEIVDAYPGNNDNGCLRQDEKPGLRRPFRSSSLFAGFESSGAHGADESNELNMSDCEYHIASSALRPTEKPQKIGHFISTDGNQSSRETNSTSGLATRRKRNGIMGTRNSLLLPSHLNRGSPLATEKMEAAFRDSPSKQNIHSKTPNIRRTALISSGAVVQTQQRIRSPGLSNLGSTMPSIPEPTPPPFPVPTRRSSKNKPLSSSEGARTPTPRGTAVALGHRRKESGKSPVKKGNIRKVRSAAALPRSEVRDRSRSPSLPPLTASTVAPDSPQLPPLPKSELNFARWGQGIPPSTPDSQQASTNTSNIGASVLALPQQISVVDAIAQTMVGDWMWKYVRQRKSFGKSESPQIGWNTPRTGDEAFRNAAGSSIRHKRWVWLAPYERAVMWSSKQPTSGPALLGKSGRKLEIQSVLDVKDDTPVPKNAGSHALFNRSILILTPSRALKFTAITKEQHYIWLTALQFLSHPSQGGVSDLSNLPPIPQEEHQPPRRQQGTTLSRNPIRDSIRVAKGKSRPLSTAKGIHQHVLQGIDRDRSDEEKDAADPPNVPRFSSHGRKRSNTGPRVRPTNTSFRSFTQNPSTALSNYNTVMNASSDFRRPTVSGTIDTRTSLCSRPTTSASASFPAPNYLSGNSFFDAVGTVRMEAFVARTPKLGFNEPVNSLSDPPLTRPAKMKDLTYLGPPVDTFCHRAGIADSLVRNHDPFRGL
ncbi:MAG: hypothetical protein M1827_005598 [Pycnora praestabilis]|nr:MAG: hypothetical protein M1827_005598 [Pycnora praestabilis]